MKGEAASECLELIRLHASLAKYQNSRIHVEGIFQRVAVRGIEMIDIKGGCMADNREGTGVSGGRGVAKHGIRQRGLSQPWSVSIAA